MGTKRREVVTRALHDAVLEELTQTRQSLEDATARINSVEAARAQSDHVLAEARRELTQKRAENHTLTSKLNEQVTLINQLQNSESYARVSLDRVSNLSAQRLDQIESLTEQHAKEVAKAADLDRRLAEAVRLNNNLMHDNEEHLRTIVRLDRYVSLAVSRGRKQ